MTRPLSITANGGAQVDTAQSKFGGASAYFDGVNDYIRVNESSADFQFGTSLDFTIEFWYKKNTTNITEQIAANRSGYSAGNWYIQFDHTTDKIQWGVNGAAAQRSTTTFDNTNWHHLVLQRSGTTFTLYIDGALENTLTGSYAFGKATDAFIDFGRIISGYGNLWIDEIRISDTARYTTGFTPATAPHINDADTLFLMHADGTDASTVFLDDNGSGRSAVGISAQEQVQIDTAQSKFGGASALFDGGTDDYLLVDHTAQDIAYSDDFTFELWVRWASLPTAFSMLAQHSARGDYFSLYNKSGTYTMHAAVSNGSSVYYPIYNTPVTPTTNTWYHLAFVKSGSSFKMFWDGTECTTNNGSVNSMSADKGGNGIRRIGDYAGGSSYAMNGHIDEVRYSKIARYTTNFTPATTAHVNDADTLFLMHMDGTDASTTFLDDNGSGRSAVGIAAAGNAQVDTAQSKFGGASAVFDGSGDYIYTAGGNNWDLSGDFTIEAWVYQTAQGSNMKIFDFRGITGSNPGADTNVALGNTLLIDSNTGGDFRCFVDGSDKSSAGAGSIPLNTWTHIAVQRQSGTINAWVNGTRYVNYVGSDDYSSVFNVNQPIGAGGEQTGSLSSWTGNIDEIRYSDIARYTNGTSITVPTTTFTNDTDTLLLIHADGTDGSTTFLDDNSYFEAAPAGVTHEGAADLTLGVTVTASAGVIKGTTANLSGVFSPNVIAVASRNGSIDMAVQVDFASTANRFLSTDVTLANLVNLSLQAARIRPAESDLNVSFDAITAASRTRQTSSSLAVSFEQTTTATRIKQFDATLAGVFSPAIVAIASLNGSIDAAAQTSLTVTPLRIQQLDSALSVNANLNSTGGYLLEDSASLTVSTELVARAITYQIKTEYPNDRPKQLTFYSFNNNTSPRPVYYTYDQWLASVYNNPTVTYANSTYFNSSSYYDGTSSFTFDDNSLDPVFGFETTNTNGLVLANTDFIFEFWINTSVLRNFETLATAGFGPTSSSSPSTISFSSTPVDTASRGITIGVVNTQLWAYYYSGTTPQQLTGTSIPLNTWTRIALRRINGNTLQLILGNAVQSSRNFTGLIDLRNYANLYSNVADNTNSRISFDKWNLRIGESSLSDNTTIFNPNNTYFHYRFENNFDDTLAGSVLLGSETLSSTFSATATLGGTFGASANPAAAATLTAQADKVVEATATLATAFTATTAASRLLTTDVSLNTIFSETSTAGRIRRAATSLNSAFTQNVTASRTVGATTSQDTTVDLNAISLRIKQIDSSLSAFVSTITAAGKVGDFFVDVDLQATLATTAQRTAGLTANLTTATTLTAEALRIQPGAADLDTTADFTVDVQLVSGAIASLDATSSLSAVGIRAKGLTATLNSEFAATATGVTFKGTTTALVASVVTLECAVEVTRNASAALDLTATQTVDGIKAVEGAASIEGVFSPNVIAVATRVGEIELTVTVDATTTAVKTASSTATAPATATLASSVSAIRATTVELACSADLTAAGGGLSNGVVDLTVAATLSAQGSIINTQRYVYVVPRESRVVSIAKETRTHTVHKETRIYTLGEL
jgi:hypothetical protein